MHPVTRWVRATALTLASISGCAPATEQPPRAEPRSVSRPTVAEALVAYIAIRAGRFREHPDIILCTPPLDPELLSNAQIEGIEVVARDIRSEEKCGSAFPRNEDAIVILDAHAYSDSTVLLAERILPVGGSAHWPERFITAGISGGVELEIGGPARPVSGSAPATAHDVALIEAVVGYLEGRWQRFGDQPMVLFCDSLITTPMLETIRQRVDRRAVRGITSAEPGGCHDDRPEPADSINGTLLLRGITVLGDSVAMTIERRRGTPVLSHPPSAWLETFSYTRGHPFTLSVSPFETRD